MWGTCITQTSSIFYKTDLLMRGSFNFTVTAMGGDTVLIKPVEGENFESFLEEYNDMVSTWFHDVRQWSPGAVAKVRDA